MPVPFTSSPTYAFAHGHVAASAFSADDVISCQNWLTTDVASRVFDQEQVDGFRDDIRALQSEGFGTEALQKYIDEPTPDGTVGDIGESIADLFLIERLGVILPSNRRRDLRSEKGSLPGADLVGFAFSGNGGIRFLFGEVKASSQGNSPPSVMVSTDSGMAVQLKRISSSTVAQRRLILYLRVRSQTPELKAMYAAALRALAENDYALIGVLVRDTPPTQKDVDGPAKGMKDDIPHPPVSLFVLHLSVATSDWHLHCKPM